MYPEKNHEADFSVTEALKEPVDRSMIHRLGTAFQLQRNIQILHNPGPDLVYQCVAVEI